MASSRELGHTLNEDGIGQLPDPLICDILSHLSIKDAVRTSSVSPKWKSHWLWVPSLELSSRQFPDFNDFKAFGGKFFDTSRTSSIQKIILDIHGGENDEEDASYLSSWIDAAVKRKVQHLNVECHPAEYLCEMPISLYICKTLVCLNLFGLKMADAEFVSLPCLTTMDLKHILYPNEATFEKLVSSCPVLDDLNVVVSENDAKSYRVHSRSLRKIFFMRASPVQLDFVSELVVDSPLLGCLSIYDNVSNTIEIKNLESDARLGMSLNFGMLDLHEGSVASRRNRVRSFLPGISTVMNMSVETDAFKLINDYAIIEPRPQLTNVSCMVVTICEADLKGLPTFLQSCPKLKYLVVGLDDYEEMPSEEMDRFTFSSAVPECMLSSLEFVDFNTDISGSAAEMKLAKYFLENSAILKKLTLQVKHDLTGYDIGIDFAKELFKIPSRSATCQIVFN